MFRLLKRAQPNTPPINTVQCYADSTDGRVKYIDENGLVRILTSVEWPKNHIINGGYNFMQRQVPGTLTTYSQVAARDYAADRHFLCNENASIQFQQVDNITAPESGMSHRYYGRYKKLTNAGKMLKGQILSAENSAVLRGKRVRYNVRMRRTVAAAMSVRLGLGYLTAAGTHDVVPGWVSGAPSGTFISAWGAVGTDPTLGVNVSRINPVAGSADGGTISGAGLTCALGAGWVRYSACFDVPSDAKNVIPMIWTDGQPAANDELNITEEQLTEGVEIADWISNPQIVELIRCQRFFVKSFPNAVAPAQNGGLTGAMVAYAVAGAVAAIYGIDFPVQLRATPTLTLYNPAAANAFTRNILKATDATVTTAANTSDRGTMINVTGLAAWAAGDGIGIHYKADAEL